MSNEINGSEQYNNEVEAFKQLGAATSDKWKIYGIPFLLHFGKTQGQLVLVMPSFDFSLTWIRENGIECSEDNFIQMVLELVFIIHCNTTKNVK